MQPQQHVTNSTSDLTSGSVATTEARLIRHIHERIKTNGDTHYQIKTIPCGEALSTPDQPLDTTFADSSCIILQGELVASGRGERHVFPAGYTIAQPALLAASWELRAGEQPLQILQLSRTQLRDWFITDDSFYNLALTRIHEVFPKDRMPALSREQIRSARDESLLARTTRQAIDFVNRRGGLFEQLNPDALPIFHHDTIGGRDRTIGATEQIWQLIEAVSPVLIHIDEQQIEQYADHAVQMGNRLRSNNHSAKIEMAAKWFQIEIAAVKSQIFERNMPRLTEALQSEGITEATELYQTIADRVLQVHSLHEAAQHREQADAATPVSKPLYLNGGWDRALCECFMDGRDSEHGGTVPLLEKLDETLELVFQKSRSIEDESVVHVRVEKFQLALDIEPVTTDELPAEHPTRIDMQTLERSITRGDLSAVGGSAYPRQRFPRVTLNQLASDNNPVSIFDGDYETGLLDIRREYGRHPVDPSLLQRGTVVRLEGVYGSFEKSWCFFRDGNSAFLVTHTGEDRQLSNAAALQLFETRAGDRIPLHSMRLARENIPAAERIKTAVDSLLRLESYARRGTHVLGDRILAPEEIPTQVHFVQHPELLLQLIRNRTQNTDPVYVIPVDDPVLQKQFIVYWRQSHGELIRLLLPTVGSRGLYGDTAGAYAKAVMLTDTLNTVSHHTFFSATCGGYAGTSDLEHFKAQGLKGLPASIAHGDLIMPWCSVGSSRGELALENILRFADSLNSAGIESFKNKIFKHFSELPIHHTSKHYCVGAPALETAGLISDMIAEGYASVDVESFRIMQSLHEVARVTGTPTTFTPLYVYSDDPRKGLTDPTQSLAFGAPLAEGSRAHPALYEALIDMLELAARLDLAH